MVMWIIGIFVVVTFLYLLFSECDEEISNMNNNKFDINSYDNTRNNIDKTYNDSIKKIDELYNDNKAMINNFNFTHEQKDDN